MSLNEKLILFKCHNGRRDCEVELEEFVIRFKLVDIFMPQKKRFDVKSGIGFL